MIRLLLILWTLWVKILEGLSDPLLEPPDFIEPLENLTVVTGRDATFSCSVSRLEEYTVSYLIKISKRKLVYKCDTLII